MGRFTTSKYKNATPKKLKREETIFNIKVNDLCTGVPIACGVNHIAWTGEGAGINVIGSTDRCTVKPKALNGHCQFVRCLDFNPFNHEVLASCSDDGLIKLWNVEDARCLATLKSPHHVAMATFNPVADSILVAAEGTEVAVYDCVAEKRILSQSSGGMDVAWSYDGRLVCGGSKSGDVTILDVRSDQIVASNHIFDNNKDVHVQWLGVDKILVGGYKNRSREIRICSITDLSSSLSHLGLGPGSGSPNACYDHDTSMTWIYTKGGQMYRYCEVDSGGVLTENWTESVSEPIKGICLAPKLSLDVMSGEVNRLVIAHTTSIRPTPCIVPRKSYSEYHSDLFPETRGSIPGIGAEAWLQGENGYRELINLNPASRKEKQKEKRDSTEVSEENTNQLTTETREEEEDIVPVEENVRHTSIVNALTEGHSIYKNVVGDVRHKNFNHHGLKNVQTVFGQEGNGFHAGKLFGAHLMGGSAGRIGVIDLRTPGQTNTPQLEVVNVGNPLVMEWDYWDPHVLAVAGDDAMIKLWKISDISTPAVLLGTLSGHVTKVIALRYHPCVEGLIASCDSTGNVIIWNTTSMTQIRDLGEVEDCLAISWGPLSGYHLFILSKSGDIHKIDIRNGERQVLKTETDYRCARMEASRNLLVISGIRHGNTRHLCLLSISDLTQPPRPLASHTLGSGTSVYGLFLDSNRNVAFLSARGEGTILPFEFREAPPHHITPLSVFSSSPVQHALSWALVTPCDVMKIEIARFYKLTVTTVEEVIFTVPRIRKEYFQDDLFPPVLDCTCPVMTVGVLEGAKWEYAPRYVDLCPEGVQRNSEVKIVRSSGTQSKVQQEHIKYKTAEKQRDELFNAFAEQVQSHAGPLQQDLMEGCDEDEWSD